MNNLPSTPASDGHKRISTPSNVQPERLSHSTSRLVLWGSILLLWLVSMLPWRQWPMAPDVLLLIIAFWNVHESRRVGLVLAFVFGLLLDVNDTGLLGVHALTYVLTAYGARRLRRRLLRFGLLSQAGHMLPVFVLAQLPSALILTWIAGRWQGWSWGVCALLTAVLWPLAGWVLQWSLRGAGMADTSKN